MLIISKYIFMVKEFLTGQTACNFLFINELAKIFFYIEANWKEVILRNHNISEFSVYKCFWEVQWLIQLHDIVFCPFPSDIYMGSLFGFGFLIKYVFSEFWKIFEGNKTEDCHYQQEHKAYCFGYVSIEELDCDDTTFSL